MAHVAALTREALSWNNVCGPAVVVRFSLERLGWSVISATQWSNTKGEIVDLDELGPREVKMFAERAAQDWTWQQAGKNRKAYEGITSTPMILPVRQVLSSKTRPNWSHVAKGWLRAACADSWDESVQVCDICQGNMSVWHACWDCPALEQYRTNWFY